MHRISERNVIKYYNRIIKRAKSRVKRQDVNKACFELRNAATLAYYFNLFYKNDDTELLIREISGIVLPHDKNDFKTRETILFYDSFGYDNRGLTQQYIRALNKLGIPFLYIFEDKDESKCASILYELNSFDDVEIYVLDKSLSAFDKIQTLYNKVVSYRPHRALLHLAPWSMEALVVFSALDKLVKFNINLTDHAYWAGSSIVDFNIEFRDYGASLSVLKRGLTPDQILMLPYYPIIFENESKFLGFPSITEGKTVLFSGGAVYKIYGEGGKFFEIIKKILDNNPATIFLFAGDGNMEYFYKFINENKLSERIFLLGNRSDINEVIKNCDIFIGTYPFCGGLMSQYAAVNGKPILSFTDPKYKNNYLEEIICHNKKIQVTFDDMSEYYAEANKLCNSKDYRLESGKELKDCVITKDQFAAELGYLLNNSHSIRRYNIDNSIDYKSFAELYVEIENKFQNNAMRFLLSKYRLKVLYLFPLVAILFVFRSIFSFRNILFTKKIV